MLTLNNFMWFLKIKNLIFYSHTIKIMVYALLKIQEF
jgi:hypothetical protein